MRVLAAAALAMSIGCRASRPIVRPEPKAPVTIGAALPLSGRLQAFGEGGREVVRLAAGELGGKDRPIRVAVRDSKGDAEGAAKAVEELVLEDGAVAIVGPLFKAEANAAADKAQSLGVPLIALTSDPSVADAGAYVFHAGLSPDAEMDALVAYAMDLLSLKTFAVLHPKTEYGERMLQLFRERAEDRGGTIYAIETYAEEDTTFTAPIRRMVKRDDPAKHPDYAAALAKCKEARDDFRKARCQKQARESLRPLIEFDALFIPDGYKKASLITAAVAAEDIIVERDPRRLEQIEKTLGYEVRPITLLGTSAWNSPELIKRAGRTVENAIFADISIEDEEDEASRRFVADFRKHFERHPEHQDALLYDATRFVCDVLLEELPPTTDDLRAAMRNGFDQARRKLEVLTIVNGKIRKAVPPR